MRMQRIMQVKADFQQSLTLFPQFAGYKNPTWHLWEEITKGGGTKLITKTGYKPKGQ